MAGEETRERLLDAAEELFAHRGISNTSLRMLTRAADVNLAAVHYHFGSKEGLLDSVVERRAGPVNRARLEALDRVEAESKPHGLPGVHAVLRAFLEPMLQVHREAGARGPVLARLFSRIQAQPAEVVEPLSRKHFGRVGARFVEALQRELPALPRHLVADRFRFGLGAILYVFSGNYELDIITGHPVVRRDATALLDQLVDFLAAGLAAPAPDENVRVVNEVRA
ncbi:MAG: TetR family transcriptional regulator [Proteobacteria bacterium]|nr:TetR family transcriptional regulator [Pseudomonadota bacterium]